MSIEIKTSMSDESGTVEVTPYSADPTRYIALWQGPDLVLVYRDQAEALIEQLQKLKESA